jgi:hypothetical protein
MDDAFRSRLDRIEARIDRLQDDIHALYRAVGSLEGRLSGLDLLYAKRIPGDDQQSAAGSE